MKRIVFSSLTILSMALLCSCAQPAKQEPAEAQAPAIVEKTVELPKDPKRIVAIVTLKDVAYAAEFEQAASAVVAGSRAEEGCVYYELGKSETPMTYAFIEVWKSQEAINIHNETPHFKAFVEAINGKADLTVCVTDKLF